MKVCIDERVSFSKWMEYMDYDNVNDLCGDVQFELKHIHDLSDYIVDGQCCVLKFGAMSKTKMFISWMSTRKNDTTFQLPSE